LIDKKVLCKLKAGVMKNILVQAAKWKLD